MSELEARARELLPADTFAYYATGSGDETTVGEATAAWRRYRFLPHVLRPVPDPDPSVTLLGARLPSPVGVAPMAFQELLHPSGELATVEGAGDRLVVVSTRASRTLEEIGAAAKHWWFQVYITRDRSLTTALVQRAAAAGASALVLTGDTPFPAVKAQAGRVAPLGDESTMRNFGRHLGPDADPAMAIDQSPEATEDEIGRLAEESGLPVLVKGVLRPDDAARCLAAGAAGLIVSNHGGRQLDRAVPTAVALPEVVAAAGDAPVLVDSGIRTGHDVLAALALGARGVLLGRPVAWALACGGADGVRELLDDVTDGFTDAMALAGSVRPDQLTPDLVRLG